MKENSFASDLEQFFYERQYRATAGDKKYKELLHKSVESYDVLKDRLSSNELRRMLCECSDIGTNLQAHSEYLNYKQGFKDGLMLIIQTLLSS